MTIEYGPHEYAMEAAFFADAERKRGNEEKAVPLFEKALELELQALKELEDTEGLWWSVLYRSAGWPWTVTNPAWPKSWPAPPWPANPTQPLPTNYGKFWKRPISAWD